MVAFSLTFPATRAALPAFGPVTVGLGRAVLASVPAALCLLVTRSRRPSPGQLRRLGLVALGVVVGFPICSSLALRDAAAAHAAVLTGLLPAATAAVAVVRAGERPPRPFWAACALGAATVLVFAMTQGGGRLRVEDGWLVAAVALGALGYAEGGALAGELGGWRVISWALVLALPLCLAVTAVGLLLDPPRAPTPGAWLGLLYVSAISMFAGFYAWYRGLAEGGIARIAQLQLAQPVLTFAWSAVLLGEAIGTGTLLAGLAVVGSVTLTQRTRRRPAERPPPTGEALVVAP